MEAIKRPNTLAEVRDGLCQMYVDVMSDPRKAGMVHEGANALGKVVGATKVYLEFCGLSGMKPSGDWARFIGNIK